MRDAGKPGIWSIMTNHQRFGVFFLGSALSNVGTWCQNIAGILLIYRLTQSTLMVGVVTLVQFAAPVLLAPVAGLAADRYDRRSILKVAQSGGAGVSAVLAATVYFDNITVPLALAAIFALGLFQAFQSPAQLSLVPFLVSEQERESGLSLSSMQFNLARVIGPVIASALVVAFGIWAAFAFNACSYFAYLIALGFIRPRQQPPGQDGARFADALGPVRADPTLMLLMLVGLVSSGASDAVNTLGPAISAKFTGSDESMGLLVSAFGLGAVISVLFLVPLLQHTEQRLPITLAVQALGGVLFAAAPSLVWAGIGAAVSGAGFIASTNRALALVQVRVNPLLLGRITALWLMAFLGGRALYALGQGALATAIGPEIAGLAAAATVLAAAAVAAGLDTGGEFEPEPETA